MIQRIIEAAQFAFRGALLTDAARTAFRTASKPKARLLTDLRARDILLALTQDQIAPAARLLASAGVDLGKLRAELASIAPERRPDAWHLLAMAGEERRLMGDKHVGTEHLLLALARPNSSGVGETLASHGATQKKLKALIADAERKAYS